MPAGGSTQGGDPVDWDAAAYQRLSTPQRAWADEVLDRLELRGDEVILDLGCGTGQVTEKLVHKVPRGRVVGVDASDSMLDVARARLGATAELIVADLRSYVHPHPVDVVFSTATLHWIPDHPSLWQRIRRELAPGGRLEAQYGGAGNIESVVTALHEVTGAPPFADYLAPYTAPWTFDAPDTALHDVRAAGLHEVRTWSQTRIARPPDARAYLANSIVPTELARLPADLRRPFVDALFTRLGRPDSYDYVRINVSAVG